MELLGVAVTGPLVAFIAVGIGVAALLVLRLRRRNRR